MPPPDGSALLELFGAGLMGAIGSWIRDKVKSAVTEERVSSFLKQYDKDRAQDQRDVERRHQDNNDAIERLETQMDDLNRYLRRAPGH
jgi:hypothetical protein